MRALVVSCLLLALVALLWATGGPAAWLSGAETAPPGATGSTAPNDASSSTGAGLGRGTVATRTEPMRPDTEGLADAVTACLQVVDHATMKPIAGAAVRRVQ